MVAKTQTNDPMDEYSFSFIEYFAHFRPNYRQKKEGISTFVTVKPEIMSFYRRKILQIFISLALTGSPKMTTKFIRGSLKLQ